MSRGGPVRGLLRLFLFRALYYGMHDGGACSPQVCLHTFEGNVNSYVVNTIPKSEKEFKKYIDEVVSEDIFKFVSNTNAFITRYTTN